MVRRNSAVLCCEVHECMLVRNVIVFFLYNSVLLYQSSGHYSS